MKDLSSSFKDITEEIKEYAWYKERPYSEADWKEFAKIQYMRYIRHLHSEIQAQGALR